jgi:hypothetical protein
MSIDRAGARSLPPLAVAPGRREDLLRLDRPGRHQHYVVGRVPPAVIIDHHVARHPLDRFLFAQNVVRERMLWEAHLVQKVPDPVLEAVGAHRDLFENHAPLGVKVGRRQTRPHHVAEQLELRLDAFGRHPPEIDRVLLAGEGVVDAAQLVEAHIDLAPAAGRRALEAHVLEEVAHPVLVGLLVARPRTHEESHRGGAYARHDLADDPETVRQLVFDESRLHGAGFYQLSPQVRSPPTSDPFRRVRPRPELTSPLSRLPS